MRYFFSSFALCLLFITAKAQEAGVHRCYTAEYTQQKIETNPDLAESREKMENWTQDWVANNEVTKQMENIVTIPVVVHVIHNNDITNIDDEKILTQLEVLNKDFRRLNTDTTDTPPIFQGVAADIEIEFCLAQRDPIGLPTTGITRTFSEVTTFTTSLDDAKFTEQGGKDGWPRDQYLNMWIVPNITSSDGGDVLGYAQFPDATDNPLTDGIVLSYDVVGTIQPLTGSYVLGRTGTHEIGHWLNLRHIWGDGPCEVDDGVLDTPISDESNFGCPSGHNSCTDSPEDLIDMIQNYMDYTNDACQNMFTLGQKARMRSQLAPGGFRFSITQSLGCVPVEQFANDVVLNEIVAPYGAGNCNTVVPIIEIRNFGSAGLFYFEYEYTVGGAVQTGFWSGSITDYEFYEVELDPISVPEDELIQSIEVTLLNPNGSPDMTDNNTLTADFATITFGDPIPYTDSFEVGATEFNNFDIINPDELIGFDVTANAASDGESSIYMSNAIYNATGTTDEFIIVNYDLNSPAPSLTFDVAYALKNTSDVGDILEVLISTDCGETFTPLYSKSGSELATAAPVSSTFIPNNEEWRTETISLWEYRNAPNADIAFRQTRGEGNNLYIDNINITAGAVGINDANNEANTFMVSLLPNPAQNNVRIAWQGATAATQIELYDNAGRLVLSRAVNNSATTNLDVSQLTPGIYFVNISNGKYAKVEKLTIVK